MKSYHNDEKRRKTKERSNSARNYELMRQEEMERQCEEFFISLDCDSHEDVVRDESKNDVEEEKTQTLEVSLPSETRSELGGLSGLSYTCESVLERFYNQGLDECLGLKVCQFMTMFGDEKHWSLSRDDKGNGSYTLLCSGFQNVFLYDIFYSDSEVQSKGGKIYDLLTPHFHYFMLVRLVIGLVNMVVVIMLFIRGNGVLCLILCKVSIMERMFYFNMLGKYYGLMFLRVNTMNVVVLKSDLLVMYLSRLKMIEGSEIKQKTCFCFTDNVLILRSNIEIIHLGICLNCCHLGDVFVRHFLYLLSEILSKRVPREPVRSHLDSSKSRKLFALHVIAYPHLCLSVNDRMLHMLRHRVFELMKWFEPTWYCKMRSISLIGFKQRVYEHGVSTHLNATQISGFHYASVGINREFGCYIHDATVLRPRHFMIIFDPGGVCVKPSLGVAFEHDNA